MIDTHIYKLTEFPNGKVDPSRLSQEISLSTITIALDSVSTGADECQITFKAPLPVDDVAVLDAVVSAHSGDPLPDESPAKSPDGVTYVQSLPIVGQEVRKITGNWCDKTTWWYSSTREENLALTSVDGRVWTPDTQATLIDVKHGKVTKETKLRETYGTVVRVDGVEKKEHDPGTSNGDYSVDYHTGIVTFRDVQSGVVTMGRSVAGSATWVVKPDPGKVLQPHKTKTIFSHGDVEMQSALSFQVYAEVGKFPYFEAYRQANGGPYPDGTMLPIAEPIKYQTIADLITEADATYPMVPSVGTNWRALSKPVTIMEWNYRASIPLRSDWGMELRIELEDDIEFSGTLAVTTVYFLVA